MVVVVSRKAIDILEDLTSDLIKYIPKGTDKLEKWLDLSVSKIHRLFDTVERMTYFHTLFSNKERKINTVATIMEEISCK